MKTIPSIISDSTKRDKEYYNIFSSKDLRTLLENYVRLDLKKAERDIMNGILNERWYKAMNQIEFGRDTNNLGGTGHGDDSFSDADSGL